MSEIKQDELLVSILEKKDTIRATTNKHSNLKEISDKLNLRDLSLFHIEELTFEEESPRREAFENVISSLRIDGIIFVYLLVGDKKGVSFYFGIAKDLTYNKELELDVDDIGKSILKSSIVGNFRGSKVEEIKNKKDLLDKLTSMKRVAKIDGVPSVNKEQSNSGEKKDFQGIDRLVDVMSGEEFALIVLADPLTMKECEDIESSLYTIHNKLSPLSKLNVQESNGESETKGDSTSKSESNAVGTNSSKTSGENQGTTKGTSTTEGTNSSYSSSSTGTSDSVSEGTNTSDTNGNSETKTFGVTTGTNSSTTTNSGTNKSREFTNKVASEWIQYIDEILLKRVAYGRSKGLFNSSVYLLAEQKGVLLKLGNTISSIFSGSEDNKAPLQFEYVDDKNEISYIHNFQIPSADFTLSDNHKQARILFSKNSFNLASWLSANELSVIASLPQKEVVGLALKEEVEFGLNIKNNNLNIEDKIFLGNLVQSGKVLDIEIDLSKNDLDKHIFIAGVTGSGKTTTCQRILESANTPFMVIEPAKTEYRVMLCKRDDITIFTLGDDRVAPFRLNPFEFFPHESISSRIDMIKANIEAAFDMEAAIPQIIESALYECYEKFGWDITTSKNRLYENPFEDGVFAFPTLSDLIKQVETTVIRQGFDDRLKNDYIGSIKARLQGLIVGAKGSMLNTSRSIDFLDLVEKNIILELEEIKNGAEKSLIMGFVLININEAIKAKYKEYKKNNKIFKHITLIEEAHRLLSKYSAGDSPNKKLGVETFADMLAEVRKYGESLIIVDQIPNKLTPEVLKNTNTKIVHKIFAQDDKEAIGNTMSLKDEQKNFLSNLETGRVIISNQSFAKPIQVQIKSLEDVSTTSSNIVDENIIRKKVLEYYQKTYKRGVVLGIENSTSMPSIEQIEDALKNNLNGLSAIWQSLLKEKKEENFKFLKDYLENKFKDNFEYITNYIGNKFYCSEDGCSLEDKKEYIGKFLQEILIGKNEIRKEDIRILRIRG